VSDNVFSLPVDPIRMVATEPRPHFCPPKNVLQGALERADQFKVLVIAGLNEDGTLFAASTSEHVADTILAMDRVRQKLMRDFDDDNFG
jgi:hypothetical protein